MSGASLVSTHRDVAPTIGAIARKLGEPIHRVEYAVRTRRIEPECLAGNIRVFAPDAVDRVADALREIDRQKTAHLARGGGDMRSTARVLADHKEAYIRQVRRVACRLAQELASFDADMLWQHIPKPPQGVDPRVIGNALHGLRSDGLIERVEYRRLNAARTHGRPQSVWRATNPAGLDEWLRQNPPAKEDSPTSIQLELPI
jgi:ribosomal protein L19E